MSRTTGRVTDGQIQQVLLSLLMIIPRHLDGVIDHGVERGVQKGGHQRRGRVVGPRGLTLIARNLDELVSAFLNHHPRDQFQQGLIDGAEFLRPEVAIVHQLKALPRLEPAEVTDSSQQRIVPQFEVEQQITVAFHRVEKTTQRGKREGRLSLIAKRS